MMPRFISDREIKKQWERVLSQGWLEHFEEGSAESGEAVENLIAIGSRETNLDPKWLTKLGDAGHGAGLMQIDIRSFPTFVNSGEWRDARQGILKGADVLADKRKWIVDNAGKTRKVKQYSFVVPALSGDALTRCAIAAYNSGTWAAYHVSKGRDPDRGTTDANYSADVMDRAKAFKRLYDAHHPEQVDEPIQNGEVTEPALEDPPVETTTEKVVTTTVVDKPGSTVVEKISSSVSSIAGNEQFKTIASEGVTKLATKAVASVTVAGTGATAGAATASNPWPWIILAIACLLIVGGIVGFVLWHRSRKENQAAIINSDKDRADIKFAKK